MSIQVKLVRSLSGHTKTHRATVNGLGLTRVGQTRIVQDTPSNKGMIAQVAYLLEISESTEQWKPFGRRARAKEQAAAAAKTAKK
ncbi:MAG: 50S ribosomal protein L30 [Deltaproteobacteria bacterium]|nr:50S ribosomal protein L30 [Deltaproteobacteria bacterium]